MNARSIRYFNDFKTFIVKNEPHLICQQLKFIIVSDPNLFFLQFIPDRYMYTYFFYFLSRLELRRIRVEHISLQHLLKSNIIAENSLTKVMNHQKRKFNNS